MKGAWLGFYALSLLGMHLFFLLLERLGRFPYFQTPLYPLVLLFVFIIAMLGVFERDRRKAPAITAMIVSAGMIAHWVVMLVLRLKS